MAVILDGTKVSSEALASVKLNLQNFVAGGNSTPTLAAVFNEENPASALYVRKKEEACQLVGMNSVLVPYAPCVSQEKLEKIVQDLSEDPKVSGIIVQIPAPEGIDTKALLSKINVCKDVDGLTFGGREYFTPCTPKGILALLRAYNIGLEGRHVVVVGRSDIVGRPLANLMSGHDVNANVTQCHSKTDRWEYDLGHFTRMADVLVAAVGRPELIRADMVKPKAVVVDVGITRIPDASRPKGYRLVGDVDYNEVSKVASFISRVTGGVGPMTVVSLIENTLIAASKQAISYRTPAPGN